MAKRTTKTISEKAAIPSANALYQMILSGMDLDGKSPARPTQPYAQSEWVYICVNAIIEAAKSIQMNISTRKEDIVEAGPAYELLYNCPTLPFSQFIQDTCGFLALYHSCYWIFTERVGLRPTKLAIAGPGQVKPEIQNGQLLFYRFTPSDGGPLQSLLIDDVWPLIGWNPNSKFRGVGAADAGEIAISTAHQAALFNEASMANGGKLSGLITLPAGVKLDDTEKQYLMSQFEAKHRGAKNAGKWALMTGGADVKPFSQTMADMDMVGLRQFDAKTICSVFGVPPEVVGLATEAQYAHGPAQQRFILNTIASLLSFIAENITLGILRPWRFQKDAHKAVSPAASKLWLSSQKTFRKYATFRRAHFKAMSSQSELFAWFAIEEHPTVKEMLQEQAGKVLDYTKSGVVLNDIIDAYDLPFEKRPHGDYWWTGMGTVPADYILEGGLEAVTGPARPEGDGDIDAGETAPAEPAKAIDLEINCKARQDKLTRIWKKWAASWLSIEMEYESALRGFFRRQQKELIGKLKAAMDEAKKTIKVKSEDVIARVVFDLVEQNGKLKMIHKVFYDKATKLGAAQTLSETSDLTGDALRDSVQRVRLSVPVRQAMEKSSTMITKVNVTTRKWVASQLRQGLEKGEGLADLTNRLADNKAFGRGRAGTIARTQTSGAVSSGRWAGMKEAGVQKKGWVSARDNAVRPEHKAAEQKYAAGIPMDEPFLVGGESLMFPCDPSGSAAMIANCRCLQIAVLLAGGKTLTPDDYDRVKFVNSSEIKTLLNEV